MHTYIKLLYTASVHMVGDCSFFIKSLWMPYLSQIGADYLLILCTLNFHDSSMQQRDEGCQSKQVSIFPVSFNPWNVMFQMHIIGHWSGLPKINHPYVGFVGEAIMDEKERASYYLREGWKEGQGIFKGAKWVKKKDKKKTNLFYLTSWLLKKADCFNVPFSA